MLFSKFTTTLVAVAATLVGAAVPSTKRFDLTEPSYDLFRHKTLKGDTVQQSFAFDQKNRRLFVAQRKNGSGAKAGDLTITQLDFSGKQLGYMHLLGFGHGVNFGAQGVGSATYLWTEVEANANGYGKKLGRFQWQSGKTLSKTNSGIKKYAPVAGATEYTASIDGVANRLVVRYAKGGAKHIAVYDLAKATKGDFGTKLAHFKQPVPSNLLTKSFQGYAAHGQYLYLMWGQSKDATGGKIDSQLVSVDMNTGKVKQGPVLTKAGESLVFREAEGLAVYKTAAGQVRLFLGFASGKSGDRRSNLFYKNALV